MNPRKRAKEERDSKRASARGIKESRAPRTLSLASTVAGTRTPCLRCCSPDCSSACTVFVCPAIYAEQLLHRAGAGDMLPVCYRRAAAFAVCAADLGLWPRSRESSIWRPEVNSLAVMTRRRRRRPPGGHTMAAGRGGRRAPFSTDAPSHTHTARSLACPLLPVVEYAPASLPPRPPPYINYYTTLLRSLNHVGVALEVTPVIVLVEARKDGLAC